MQLYGIGKAQGLRVTRPTTEYLGSGSRELLLEMPKTLNPKPQSFRVSGLGCRVVGPLTARNFAAWKHISGRRKTPAVACCSLLIHRNAGFHITIGQISAVRLVLATSKGSSLYTILKLEIWSYSVFEGLGAKGLGLVVWYPFEENHVIGVLLDSSSGRDSIRSCYTTLGNCTRGT